MSNDYFGFNTQQASTLKELLDTNSSLLSILNSAVSNLNDWGVALVAKLNADAGVADTNYTSDTLANLSG